MSLGLEVPINGDWNSVRRNFDYIDAQPEYRDRIVTALPANPTNGQTIVYQNAAMLAQGAAYQLKYVAATPGSFKWTYIGGSSYRVETVAGTAGITGAGNWNDFTSTAGGTITFPLAGFYIVHVTASSLGAAPTVAFIWQLGFQKNGATNDAFGLGGIGGASAGGASYSIPYYNRLPATQWAAGDTIRLIYYTINVGFSISNHHIVLEPIVLG